MAAYAHTARTTQLALSPLFTTDPAPTLHFLRTILEVNIPAVGMPPGKDPEAAPEPSQSRGKGQWGGDRTGPSGGKGPAPARPALAPSAPPPPGPGSPCHLCNNFTGDQNAAPNAASGH